MISFKKYFYKYMEKLIAARFVNIEYMGWQTKYKTYYEKYDIDESFYFNGNGILLYGNGKIYTGKNSYIGERSRIQAYDGCCVRIGDNCAISHYVHIYTQNANADEIINSGARELIKKGDVVIGDNCWIGANVFIRENVTIGSNVVIGANSVVIRDIPSGVIVSGVPAVIIRRADL